MKEQKDKLIFIMSSKDYTDRGLKLSIKELTDFIDNCKIYVKQLHQIKEFTKTTTPRFYMAESSFF
jgi:hypothetical protein